MGLKYKNIGVRNSHMWLLVKYDNKSRDDLKLAYGAVIESVEHLAENQGDYSREQLEIMSDNLECLHYGFATLLGVSIQDQIKAVRGGLVG